MNTASCERNYNLSILLHLFFSSNILGMLLRRVTCFHQNLTLKKKPHSKGMCVTHHKVNMLYVCVQLATPALSCQVFCPFSALAWGTWKEYVPLLPLLCRAIERCDLWVTVMGWAPYGLFLSDSALITVTHNMLSSPNGKPLIGSLVSCYMDGHFPLQNCKLQLGRIFLANQC